jgi:enoyl-CoA hydratase/carnithine racemase
MTCDLIAAIRHCRRPVVAALNGVAAGAGAVIASACDIRIASAAARIAFLFPKVGLSGADMGACWLLPRLVGASRAAEILMTGEFVDPQEALRIGLYHRVVPQESVLPEARAWAVRLARGPVTAHGVTKRMLDREASMTLEEALAAEAAEQARLMEHPDFREAYEAGREKRPPRFA